MYMAPIGWAATELPIYGIRWGGWSFHGGVCSARRGSSRSGRILAIDEGIAGAERPFTRNAGDLSSLRERLLRTMWDNLGISRAKANLTRGLAELDRCASDLRDTGLTDQDRAFNLTWHDWLNLQSLIDTSRAIGAAAMVRENSRGAHFREDYPEEGIYDSHLYGSHTSERSP